MLRKNKLLLGILGILICCFLYFGLRPYWRLPFDLRSPFEAVIQTEGIAIGVQAEKWDERFYKDKPWHKSGQKLAEALAGLNLTNVGLKEFWILPHKGTDQEVFTLLASANNSLNEEWNPMLLGEKQTFNNVDFYAWPQDKSPAFYLCQYGNLIISGKFPFQIEQAITAIQEGNNWAANEAFSTMIKKKTTIDSTQQWQLIMNGENWKSAWEGEWTEDPRNSLFFSQLDWMTLNIAFQDSSCTWSGQWLTKTTVEEMKQPLSLAQLPEIVQWATSLTIDSPSQGSDYKKYIEPWSSQTCLLGAMPSTSQPNVGKGDFWILSITDTTAFRISMEALIKDRGITDKIEYQTYEIQQTLSPTLLQPFTDRKGLNPWWVVLEDKVWFSVSPEALKQTIDYHLLAAAFFQNEDYLNVSKLIKEDAVPSTKEAVFKTSKSSASFLSFFQHVFPEYPWLSTAIFKQEAFLTNENTYQFKGAAMPLNEKNERPLLSWTLDIDLENIAHLIPVISAKTGKTQAVIAQDTSGDFRLIGTNGTEIFRSEAATLFAPLYRMEIPGEGDIIVGTSAAGVESWDLKGNRRNGFMVNGASPLSSPLAVDFSANKNWQLFYPSSKKNIKSVDFFGDPAKGWANVNFADSVTNQLIHLELPEIDLIMTLSEKGNWIAWNREGERQFEIESKEDTPVVGPIFYQKNQENTATSHNRFVAAHASGNVQVVSFSGEHFSLPLGRGPLDHFLLVNGWGDERADYLAQRGNLMHLFAYAEDGFTERWQYRLPKTPDTLIAGGESGTFALFHQQKQIFGVDHSGNPLPGFPVAGEQTAIPILQNSLLEGLITRYGKTIYCYRWE